ncbi:DUF2777 family protein [Ectobacillus ponti]|uniref:DUF2777 domain-containing protein n=1 Tax=Ectobacillus ponti TaxID=2961894 RepID=A0AA41XA56_9BACI|nr:DUF2777 family protein [Ectobacillus ponti]MCP8968251.1 DUF2777 domain-containing protein [Ectobacillus ponti]
MQNRYSILRNQARAHTIGSVEYMNEEWIFFDEETDEAALLSDVIDDTFEILYNNHWLPARFYEQNTLKIENEPHVLQDGELVRVRKKLPLVYEELLKELSEEAFLGLSSLLQEFDYSLYDCIYCHNSLFFQPGNRTRQGVNFVIYDNGDRICSLHHFFIRDKQNGKDEFQLVRADGTRKSWTPN